MPKSPRDKPAVYRIRSQGALDAGSSGRVWGMTVAVSDDPNAPLVTTLTGTLPNQDALESVLQTLYTLGLPLLSLEYLGYAPKTGPKRKTGPLPGGNDRSN